MGINVYIKDEGGAVLGSVVDERMVLSRFSMSRTARDTRLLRYLDPAGDLMLNRAQATTLLEDLAGIIPTLDGPAKAMLEGVRELAEQCERGTHLYMWFLGD
jgi:hypothetical protein